MDFLRGCTRASVLVLVLGWALLGAPLAHGDGYDIRLRSRTIAPDPSEKLGSTPEPGCCLIQLYDGISSDEVNSLAAAGITVLAQVNAETVVGRVAAGADTKNLGSVRWWGKLLPEDKLSPLLNSGMPRTDLLVDVFEGAPLKDVYHALLDAGADVYDHPDLPEYLFYVKADGAAMEQIAALDDVSYVYHAPQSVIVGAKTWFCPGAMTEFGAIPKFVVFDQGWDGAGQGSYALTFNFNSGGATSDLSTAVQESEIFAAMQEWARFADVTFTETATENANDSVDIFFAEAAHGDAFPFDGSGNTLAHAFYPSNSETIRGDMHFDDAEDWTDDGLAGPDLFSVALHELGHALGLGHSLDPDAVMYAAYSAPYEALTKDDVDGIQSIYASADTTVVIAPNGGEQVIAGTQQAIYWHGGSSTGSTVAISLLKDGVDQGDIVSSTANDGSYTWEVPGDLTPDRDYRIKVRSTSNGAVNDQSNADFRVNPPCTKVFTVRIPNEISQGSLSGYLASVSGVGTVTDVDVVDITMKHPNLGQVQVAIQSPTPSAIYLGANQCNGSAIDLTGPFGFDDEAASSYGSVCPPLAGDLFTPVSALSSFDGEDSTGNWLVAFGDSTSDANIGHVLEYTLRFTVSCSPGKDVSPASLSFGSQDIGDGATAAQTVAITNNGDGPLFITSVSVSGSDSSQFPIDGDSGETSLNNGQSRTVDVVFDPSTEGAKSATLSVVTNDGNTDVSLSGTGTAPAGDPEIDVSPLSIDFGPRSIDAGATAARTITITNTGPGDLTISSVSLTGADSAEFSIDSDTGETTLVQSASRTVTVSFDPASSGSKTAALRIQSDDSDEPTVDVDLAGSGFDPSVGVASPVYVDLANNGFEDGSALSPFNTVSEGVDYVTPGGTVNVAAGTYGDTGTFGKACTIDAPGGTVSIGG